MACHLDILQQLASKNAIQKALNGLPDDFDQTYDRMLRDVEPKNRNQVANTLKWLGFSARPLYVDEVAEIFNLDPEKNIPFDESNRLLQPEAVLRYFRGIVDQN